MSIIEVVLVAAPGEGVVGPEVLVDFEAELDEVRLCVAMAFALC